MPRTCCSKPPPGPQTSIAGLLNLIQPASSSANSILHNAVRSLANDKSASPLIRTLSALERRLVQLTDTAERSVDGEWEGRMCEQLVAICEALQRVDESTVARPLSELFPELDGLLLSLLVNTKKASAVTRSLLLACCNLLVRAALSTSATAWPRWLLSPPSRSIDCGSALTDSVTAVLLAADVNPGLLFASAGVLASLCSSTNHATAVSVYLAHNRLLPILGRLYQQQCALVVQRVQALMDRGQRRLLEDMWADGGQQEWQLVEAMDEASMSLSDRQQLLLLSRLQTIIETAIRCGRHVPRQRAVCDLCSGPSLFNTLLAAVLSLWDCLLTSLHRSFDQLIGDKMHILSMGALSLVYEATYKSKQQARGGASEFVGHISVISQLLDSSSVIATSFYPLLLTVVEQLIQWLPESPLQCTSVLGSVASAVLEIAMAQRQKTEAQLLTLPTRPCISEQATAEQRLDLSPLILALLRASTACVGLVVTNTSSVELHDSVDSCTQATLEAHAYYFRHSVQSGTVVLPDFLSQTSSSLVPLACSILSLTAASIGQPLSAVAVLAVNLERLIEGYEVRHLSRQLLASVTQHGLLGWSWRARDVLQRLHEQYRQQGNSNSTQFKQLEAAQSCFDRYLSKLMATTEWWPQTAGSYLQRSEHWMEALDTLFSGAHADCLTVIESLHSYAGWRTATNTTASDQLHLVLTLATALLLNRPTKQAHEQHADDNHEPVSKSQQLAIDVKKLVSSIEQLLVAEKQKQSGYTSLHPLVLSRGALLYLSLVLLIIERLHRHSASTRAKAALFGFLAASDVSSANIVLSPPLQCCVDDKSLGHWLWQQSTVNQGVLLLHDQLLSSMLSPPAEERATNARLQPLPTARDTDGRVERTHRRLSNAAETLAAVKAAGPLQALVRRWQAVVQRWRDTHLGHNVSVETQHGRSDEIEELLLCTTYLTHSCDNRLATLDPLGPLNQLLEVNYHRLLLPIAAPASSETLFSAVAVAAWLVHTLASLLSASAVPQHIPTNQLEQVFDVACDLLFTFSTSDVDASDSFDGVVVARSCVQLMNAVLACVATSQYDARRDLLRSFTSHEHGQDAMARLISTGFSPAPWTASNNTACHRALRVHLSQASDASCEHSLQLFRLQLQVDCMLLCTSQLLSSTEVAYAMLDWEQCMAVLSHPCDEMKAAAFHTTWLLAFTTVCCDSSGRMETNRSTTTTTTTRTSGLQRRKTCPTLTRCCSPYKRASIQASDSLCPPQPWTCCRRCWRPAPPINSESCLNSRGTPSLCSRAF